MNDALIFKNETMFFDIVQTTPDEVEAEDMVRRARAAVLREKAGAVERGDTRGDQAMSALLTRLNDELHYITQKQNRVNWRDAVKSVCGQQSYEAVIQWLELKRAGQ